MSLKYIELFAGCGGMSLGLEAAGFELFFANELSPMAGETFAYNILNEDLTDLVEKKKSSDKVLWIKSKFKAEDLQNRLRENPFEDSKMANTDLDKLKEIDDFDGKLLIGNINHLLSHLAKNEELINEFQKKNIDILSGGPPCQGFSLAGRRIKDDHKNLLPLSFAKFAGLVKPKIVLLENVKGITAPFEVEGVKHFAWIEVAKAFSLEGFIPVCLMLNSKYFSIPQNRPRFILIGIRSNIYDSVLAKSFENRALIDILESSKSFFEKVTNNKNDLDNIGVNDLPLYDIDTDSDLFDGKFFPKIKTKEGEFISAEKAIGTFADFKELLIRDIKDKYSTDLNRKFRAKRNLKNKTLENHISRKHSYLVKARFRLYQVLNKLKNGSQKETLKMLSNQGIENSKIEPLFKEISKHRLLVKKDDKETLSKISSEKEFLQHINSLRSRKHSQRALKDNEPAPAQLTIPDDICHYNQLRTLTVREMARFQSFPDWFVFRSKITTGGSQRKFEVPQYTQVGNAVPPLLAYELGKAISTFLSTISDVKK